jgi:WD40 repeat protein
VAFSPDGERLAGHGPDGSLGIYDVRTGSLIVNFTVSSGRTPSVQFSPDGRRVLTGSNTLKVRVWDAFNGRLLHVYEGAHDGTVERVAYSPDGKRMASSGGTTIKIWNLEAGKLQATLPSPNVQVSALVFSPDGCTLVSGGSDRVIRIWDVATGRERSQLSGHASAITALAFRPDGRHLLSAEPGVATLWDIDSGRPVRTIQQQAGPICQDGFNPDGETLASSTYDRMLKLWEASHPAHAPAVKPLSIATKGLSIACVASSPDGRRIAAGSGTPPPGSSNGLSPGTTKRSTA